MFIKGRSLLTGMRSYFKGTDLERRRSEAPLTWAENNPNQAFFGFIGFFPKTSWQGLSLYRGFLKANFRILIQKIIRKELQFLLPESVHWEMAKLLTCLVLNRESKRCLQSVLSGACFGSETCTLHR